MRTCWRVFLPLLAAVGLMAGCATPKPPAQPGPEFKSDGWMPVADRGAVKVWQGSGSFAVTRNNRLLAIMPSAAGDEWVQIYDEGNRAVYVDRGKLVVKLFGRWNEAEIQKK